MSKYSEIEIQTAKRLNDAGYKWLGRDKDGGFYAYSGKPYKSERCWVDKGNGRLVFVSGKFTQIFQSIEWTDNEPTYIEDIISPQVLDDIERRYLECVLRPLPKVKCIRKIDTVRGEYLRVIFETISLAADDYTINDELMFPFFKTGTMYTGMISRKDYTPKELRLNLGGEA